MQSVPGNTPIYCRKLSTVILLNKSFIYEIIETFCFPKENIQEIYKKYEIERVGIFHLLTDTDSKSLKFMFLSDPNSKTPDAKFRDIIKLAASLVYHGLVRALLSLAFEVIMASENCKRFHSSLSFWDIFLGAMKENKKSLGTMKLKILITPEI